MIAILFRAVFVFITFVSMAGIKLALADASALDEDEKKIAQSEYPTKTLYDLWE